jgi:hypothetical protein
VGELGEAVASKPHPNPSPEGEGLKKSCAFHFFISIARA